MLLNLEVGSGSAVCDTETFYGECTEGHVILLTHAHYGRMELGPCVHISLGYVGCFSDVILIADRRCSGRQSCEIRVPDAEFESTRPCLKELKTYLEINYTCVKGIPKLPIVLIVFSLNIGKLLDSRTMNDNYDWLKLPCIKLYLRIIMCIGYLFYKENDLLSILVNYSKA